MNVSIIKTNEEPQDFLKTFDEYILAGYKLLDAWITLDKEQLEVVNSRIFPFNMSFDEYLAEMATIKLSLESESGF